MPMNPIYLKPNPITSRVQSYFDIEASRAGCEFLNAQPEVEAVFLSLDGTRARVFVQGVLVREQEQAHALFDTLSARLAEHFPSDQYRLIERTY